MHGRPTRVPGWASPLGLLPGDTPVPIDYLLRRIEDPIRVTQVRTSNRQHKNELKCWTPRTFRNIELLYSIFEPLQNIWLTLSNPFKHLPRWQHWIRKQCFRIEREYLRHGHFCARYPWVGLFEAYYAVVLRGECSLAPRSTNVRRNKRGQRWKPP